MDTLRRLFALEKIFITQEVAGIVFVFGMNEYGTLAGNSLVGRSRISLFIYDNGT